MTDYLDSNKIISIAILKRYPPFLNVNILKINTENTDLIEENRKINANKMWENKVKAGTNKVENIKLYFKKEAGSLEKKKYNRKLLISWKMWKLKNITFLLITNEETPGANIIQWSYFKLHVVSDIICN